MHAEHIMSFFSASYCSQGRDSFHFGRNSFLCAGFFGFCGVVEGEVLGELRGVFGFAAGCWLLSTALAELDELDELLLLLLLPEAAAECFSRSSASVSSAAFSPRCFFSGRAARSSACGKSCH
jgi:hypothetical protein